MNYKREKDEVNERKKEEKERRERTDEEFRGRSVCIEMRKHQMRGRCLHDTQNTLHTSIWHIG